MVDFIQNAVSCQVTWEQVEEVSFFSAFLSKKAAIDSALNANFDTDASPEAASFALTLPQAQEGIMAVYQHKPWWLRPAFPENYAAIPPRTQLLLQRTGGEFIVILAVCDSICRADFSGTADGIRVSLSANGCPGDDLPHIALCLAHGSDPYACIHNTVLAVCKRQGREYVLRQGKQFPKIFRRLGWCTWNAFYKQVNEKGILTKLEEFQKKRVNIGWILIDDGWLDADYHACKLKSYCADPVKFPDGLRKTVQLAKEQFGIRFVGVWHALLGYWNGFSPGSEVFLSWRDKLMRRNGANYVLEPKEDTIYRFYNAWHSWLAEKEGISFVKVDGQGSGSLYYKGIASFGQSAGN